MKVASMSAAVTIHGFTCLGLREACAVQPCDYRNSLGARK